VKCITPIQIGTNGADRTNCTILGQIGQIGHYGLARHARPRCSGNSQGLCWATRPTSGWLSTACG